jgi:hypothetical protein
MFLNGWNEIFSDKKSNKAKDFQKPGLEAVSDLFRDFMSHRANELYR